MFKLLKHIGKVLLVGTAVLAEKFGEIVSNVFGIVDSCKKWACGTLVNRPTSMWEDVKSHLRMTAFRELLFFVGGLVCIFVFDDARGDLTWFRRMITSIGDFFGNVVTATVEGVQKKVTTFFFPTDQEVNEM